MIMGSPCRTGRAAGRRGSPPGRPHPLSEGTIAEIRDLFGLIAERERELADEAGRSASEKPMYPDQPRRAKPVAVTRVPRKPGGSH